MNTLVVFSALFLTLVSVQFANCVSPVPPEYAYPDFAEYPDSIKAYLRTHPGATVTKTRTANGGTKYLVNYTRPTTVVTDEYPPQVKAILLQHPDAQVVKTRTPEGKIRYEIKYPLKRPTTTTTTITRLGSASPMPQILPAVEPEPARTSPPAPEPEPIAKPEKLKWHHTKMRLL